MVYDHLTSDDVDLIVACDEVFEKIREIQKWLEDPEKLTFLSD